VADTRSIFRQVIEDETGQALTEYAIVLFLVSILSFGALALLGFNVSNMLTGIASAVGIF